MAAATVPRPAQALRMRRDAPSRPSISKRLSVMEGAGNSTNGEPAAKKFKFEEPYVRTSDYILRKFRDKQPSFAIHLHDAYWRFEDQDGSYAYESPMKFFLVHLRRQTVPHEMMEEFLNHGVSFYDGCLIVEVHNHRSVNGKDKGRKASGTSDDGVKFSMHNYNQYMTPSQYAPYPKKAKVDATKAKEQEADSDARAKAGQDKSKDADVPKISTLVLHPTTLSQHAEIMILANIPASDAKSKKRGSTGETPSSAQPPTPQISVPTTPLTASSRNAANQKMCLEPQDLYQFQAELLLATEPPLYLEPVKNVAEAQAVLNMLSHPLHNDTPPSPKTRKRTTAEMAADDAQAAEAERLMLIMDERIKSSARAGAGASAGDNQGTAASLGFSRFKTIQMVKEKVEEQERIKKDEVQAQAARKQQEEANAQALAAQQVQQQMRENHEMQRQQHLLQQQQQQQQAKLMMQQRQRLAIEARKAQVAQMQAAAQNQSHPQQPGGMMNQQSAFQHPASMAQSSPIVRQQTPMMNSSPMLRQNGFPMTATSSQGAGSPPRPTSAALVNPNMAMARQVSQQHGSRNNTPHLAQGTPHMPGPPTANKQVPSTPRMPHQSPAPGTPVPPNVPNMAMHTPQQSMTPEQMAMYAAASRNNAMANGMPAGSPGQQQSLNTNNMSPEMISKIRHQHQMRLNAQHHLSAQQQQMVAQNPQFRQQFLLQRQALLRQQQQQQQQQQMMAAQAAASGGGGGSNHPGMQQQQGNQLMGQHGHPAQQQQQQQQNGSLEMRQKQARAFAEVKQLLGQYGNIQLVPGDGIAALSTPAQVMFRQMAARQAQHAQSARNTQNNLQQMAMSARQAQNAGHAVAGNGGGNPEYMRTLRNHQHTLLQQQQQQQQQGGQMNAQHFAQQQQQQQQQQGGNNLQQHFSAMQNALNIPGQGGGGM